jgi:hypothetical protein
MKHLKKYNKYSILESNDHKFLDIVKDTFQEMIDDDLIYLDEDESSDNHVLLSFSLDDNKSFNNLDDISNHYKRIHNEIEDIKVSLYRLKDEYKNIKISIDLDEDVHITITNNFEEGRFYLKNGNIIKLDIDKIKDMLYLGKDVTVFLSHKSDNESELSIYLSKYQFNRYMYGDPNASSVIEYFDNPLLINPESKRYLGTNFRELKIDDDMLIDELTYFSRDRDGSVKLYFELNTKYHYI